MTVVIVVIVVAISPSLIHHHHHPPPPPLLLQPILPLTTTGFPSTSFIPVVTTKHGIDVTLHQDVVLNDLDVWSHRDAIVNPSTSQVTDEPDVLYRRLDLLFYFGHRPQDLLTCFVVTTGIKLVDGNPVVVSGSIGCSSRGGGGVLVFTIASRWLHTSRSLSTTS
jgi:hypothetical protein